jgi:hypothetical protein
MRTMNHCLWLFYDNRLQVRSLEEYLDIIMIWIGGYIWNRKSKTAEIWGLRQWHIETHGVDKYDN